MNEAAKRALPNTAQTDLDGQSREFRSSGGEIYFTFVLALLFIYLVLSAQFESFVNPFIIMLSVPLSMTGALFTLWLTGGTLNIYSQVGLVTLVGLITKHGILIVEFSNQLRAKGQAMMPAVIDASVLRLRPILMTTGAMVLGALPLALAHGAGAESRTQIGWVIVGGMAFGTILTLFVVPTAYTLLAGKHPAEHGATSAPAAAASGRRRLTSLTTCRGKACAGDDSRLKPLPRDATALVRESAVRPRCARRCPCRNSGGARRRSAAAAGPRRRARSRAGGRSSSCLRSCRAPACRRPAARPARCRQ